MTLCESGNLELTLPLTIFSGILANKPSLLEMPSPIFALPTELWSRTFEYAWAPLACLPVPPLLPRAPPPSADASIALKTLQALAMTCSLFERLATPLIWRRVDIERAYHFQDLLHSQSSQKRLGLTRTLVITDQALESVDLQGLKVFEQLLPFLPRLCALHVAISVPLLTSVLLEKAEFASKIQALHMRLYSPGDLQCLESLSSLRELSLNIAPLSSRQRRTEEGIHPPFLPLIDTLTVYASNSGSSDIGSILPSSLLFGSASYASKIWKLLARSSFPSLRTFTSLVPSMVDKAPRSSYVDDGAIFTNVTAFFKRHPHITNIHFCVRSEYDEKILQNFRVTSVDFVDSEISKTTLYSPLDGSPFATGYMLHPEAVTLIPQTLRTITLHAWCMSLETFERLVRAFVNESECSVQTVQVCALAGKAFALEECEALGRMRECAGQLRKRKWGAIALTDLLGREISAP